MHIRILAGPSGSGKSTHINKTELLESKARGNRLGDQVLTNLIDGQPVNFYDGDVVILSADDITFDEEGFHIGRLGGAHACCMQAFVRILMLEEKDRPQVLIVDNTNTSAWEIAPYVALAQTFEDVELEVLVFERDWESCLKRTSHGTPAHAVRQQARRLSRTLDEWPAYWPQPTFVPAN